MPNKSFFSKFYSDMYFSTLRECLINKKKYVLYICHVLWKHYREKFEEKLSSPSD